MEFGSIGAAISLLLKCIQFSLIVGLIPAPGLGQVKFFTSNSPDCQLDDVQRTPGICVPFRQCPFAIENYKAELWPKRCTGSIICCPTVETMAEKKCAEWRSYLHTPLKYGDPYPEPRCVEYSSSGFITGGREAKRYEYPHAVALGYRYDNESAEFVCGGTLISEQYVLTAAHCIRTTRGKPLVALVGDITIKRKTSNFRKLVPIIEWIPHDNYKAPITYNDIAIVKLAKKLELDRYLLPACLPRPEVNTDVKSYEAVGWGTQGLGESTSDTLRTVNLTLFSKSECDPFFEHTTDRAFKYPEGIKRSQLCVGDKKNEGKDSCNGDSGGPLTIHELYNGVPLKCLFSVEGVTSFGSKLCGYGTPGIYTKVLGYVPWIERVVFGVS